MRHDRGGRPVVPERAQEVRHQTGETIHHVGHGEEYQPRRRRLLDVALPVAHALSREHHQVHHVSGDADREYDWM